MPGLTMDMMDNMRFGRGVNDDSWRTEGKFQRMPDLRPTQPEIRQIPIIEPVKPVPLLNDYDQPKKYDSFIR